MQNQSKRVISWAIVSLIIYLGVTALTLIPAIKLDKEVPSGEFSRIVITAVILYGVTVLLAALRLRLGYYLMAVVVALYGVGLVGVLITMINGATGMIAVRLLIGLIAAFGIVVTVYWFMQVFQLRRQYINQMIAQVKARQEGNGKWNKILQN